PIPTLLASEFANVIKCHRHAMLGIEQQVVFCKEAGKEHAVPVFIGARLDKVLDLLRLAFWVPLIAKLTAMSAKLIAQLAIISPHVRPWFVVVHGILVPHDLLRTLLGDNTSLGYSVFEHSAVFAAECGHLL